MNIPRIVLAAPKSGSGKTLISISLMSALKEKNYKITGFKCGPDYIDPQFHSKILNIPSKNLDLYFASEDTVKGLFLHNNQSDFSIIEGLMGLYDGLGSFSEEASTYHLAKCLKAPIVLIVDTKGMGRSVLAEIAGFLSLDKEKLIKAVILNNLSPMLYNKMKELIEENLNISVLGYFPSQKDLQIESRHLGLKLPSEIENLKEKVKKAGQELSKTVDLQKLVDIGKSASAIKSNFTFPKSILLPQEEIRIAVAKDQAFNFYYEDNFTLLKSLGAKLIEFSPLKDKKLPDNIHGLIIGGGYPELYAKELEENVQIRLAIKNLVEKGLPVWAECGGFMYLQSSLEDKEKKSYAMCNVIKSSSFYTGKLVRFGYMEIQDLGIKAHEFHYFDSSANGTDFSFQKASNKKVWKEAYNLNGAYQGYAHMYYLSNIEYGKKIIEICKEYKKSVKEK